MKTARSRIHRRQLVAVTLVAVVITPVFNLLTSGVSLGEAVQGVVDAVLISLLVGGYMLFVREGRARPWLRRLTFRADLALSSAIVLVLFFVERAVGQGVTSRDPARFLLSFREAHLVYAVPFFAVDLLRRIVDELSEPVLETDGEIYQYAGDEVVITWPMQAGLRGANCVRCFFLIREAVARNRDRYQREFGALPAFRGGLHGGTVTAGELGDLRRQIVFVGDILNTAARLEEYAKRTDFDLVASGAVLEHLALPAGIAATPCGELALRGKEASVAAYGLTGAS